MPSRMSETRACAKCAAIFHPNFTNAGCAPQRFCSVGCYALDRWGDSPDRCCAQCGGVVTSAKRSAKFCSVACYRKSQIGRVPANRNKAVRPCSWCGEDVARAPSNFHSERTFCNYQCMAEWQSEFAVGENHPRWRGGRTASRYGLRWRPLRRRVLERSGGLCENCGREDVDEVHHKIPIRCFADPSAANTEDNLIALCRKCHRAAHKALKSTLLDQLFVS